MKLSKEELRSSRDGRGPVTSLPGAGPQRTDGLLSLALVAGVTILAATPSEARPPLEFLAFPFLVWAALRFGSSGAAAMTLTAGAIAIIASVAAGGRVAHDGTGERAFLASAYVAILASGALLVAALSRSRKRTEGQLREARTRHERLSAEHREAAAAAAERLESEVVARQRAQDALLRAQRLSAGSPLLGAIAHQLNNPLTTIRMSATYALDCEDDAGVQEIRKEALEEISLQSERSGRIVNSLLQLARSEKLEMWVEDLNKLTREACEHSQRQAGLRSASITCVLSDASAPVLANPVQIEQALLNLLDNAIASRESGAHVEVTVKREGDRLRIAIVDDGDGIPPERLARVCEPHFTTCKAGEGSGLGLGLAHEIVSQHRGRLEIESTVGVGTRVMVELPAYRAGEEDEPREAGSSPIEIA